ncbi:MAG TPA: tRNA lysidine(34) synthetase TilS [Candidatus Saccharimonadales bacterium]|nr:tRNA lysidine(34) synthetase TilS [Candidatus Saccharimonadales bacterium]
MRLVLHPGTYVLAVSGGVDSMALLHMLAGQKGLELIVAHFEHGIRADSDQDRQLVQRVAQAYQLPFVFARGELGPGASEAIARAARYAFLRRVAKDREAQAIITAHHQDDVLETAILNLLRGTGNRGLSSLRSGGDVVRPLLDVPKAELLAYAKSHQLAWHEDSTNQDVRYLRNYVRARVIPRLTPEDRARLLKHIEVSRELHERIESLAEPWISGSQLDRQTFIQLPHLVACEIMAAWLRHHRVPFDRPTIERLVVFAKTAPPSKRADIQQGWSLFSTKQTVVLEHKIAKPYQPLFNPV